MSMAAAMAKSKIPLEELSSHATSYCDRMGRLFWWQGELYRGIEAGYVGFYRQMFANGVIEELIQKKFIVETELTDLEIEGYPLVIKHRVIPFVSYASEWPAEMIKDAGLFVADLMFELTGHGLTLADASTFDLLFEGSRPLYVDLTTLVDADYDGDRTWKYFHDDFYSYYIWPLRLAAQGYGNLVRWILAEYNHKVMHDLINIVERGDITSQKSRFTGRLISTASRTVPPWIGKIAGRVGEALKPLFGDKNVLVLPRGLELLQQLRTELERIILPPPQSDPAQPQPPDLAPNPSWSQKQISVYKVLEGLRPDSVLDLGCGWGWYARLAASLGSKVVAIDIDQGKISSCYQEIKKKELPILALVMDASNPSPGLGVCNRVLAPATQRLGCDLVLALSLVEELVIEANMTFEQIAETIASFSKKWALIEFTPKEADELQEKNIRSWYSLENFMQALGKRFRTIQRLPSHPEASLLLLCEQ
jgi:hypothetical protein